MEEIKKGSEEIAEILSTVFRPADNPDESTLRLVAEYSLQLSLRQQFILNRLEILSLDNRIPNNEREKLEKFIANFQKLKRYNETLRYIGQTIEALSLRKFWSMDAMKGQVLKQQ